MLFWTIALRAIAVIAFFWTLISQPWEMLAIGEGNTIFSNILQGGTLMILCLAVAAGLDRLDHIDQRTARHSTALKLLLPPSARRTQNSDLAPEAPRDWAVYKPRPFDPLREKDSGYEQRMARRWRYAPRPPADRTS